MFAHFTGTGVDGFRGPCPPPPLSSATGIVFEYPEFEFLKAHAVLFMFVFLSSTTVINNIEKEICFLDELSQGHEEL